VSYNEKEARRTNEPPTVLLLLLAIVLLDVALLLTFALGLNVESILLVDTYDFVGDAGLEDALVREGGLTGLVP